jgi:hypothetical protein
VILLFSHPELRRDISNKGLLVVLLAPFLQQTHDQLNRRWDFTTVAEYLRKAPPYKVVDSGDVLNYVTCVMRLTHGKLLRQDNWCNWQASEFLQLDQYDAQKMFGLPVAVESSKALSLILSGCMASRPLTAVRKPGVHAMGLHNQDKFGFSTRHTLTVSTRPALVCSMGLGRLRALSFMGLMSPNAFTEAPSHKQGFYIRPDKAFHEWWTTHKKGPPIPPGHMIPILSAMQGHPELPRLWEKHADAILQELGLTPTIHEPC